MENKNNYWLKPDGKLIKVGYMGHNDYAYDILEEEMGLEKLLDTLGTRSASSLLHQRGWVRILDWGGMAKLSICGNCSTSEIVRNTIDPKMNAVQLKVSRKLCKDNNVKFLDAINT